MTGHSGRLVTDEDYTPKFEDLMGDADAISADLVFRYDFERGVDLKDRLLGHDYSLLVKTRKAGGLAALLAKLA